MNYSDKGKPINEMRKELYKPELEMRGIEFFKYPAAQAFSLASESHYHEAIECIYIDRGSLTVYIDGRWESIRSGELVLFRSMGVHSIFTDDQSINDYYVLKILPSILYNIALKSPTEHFPLRFIAFNPKFKTVWKKEEISGSAIEDGFKRLISQLNKDGKSTASTLSLTISALLVLGGLFETGGGYDTDTFKASDAVFRAIAHVEARLSEALAEDDVAKAFGISKSHFAREFKRATGKTFKQYIIHRRMEKAESLLASGKLSVSEVAEKCGYPTTSHFITMYGKIKGKTPRGAAK